MHVTFEGGIFSRQIYGGISRYFSELAAGFINSGHSVSSICPLSINQHIQSVPKLNKIGIQVPDFNKTNRIRIAASQYIANMISLENSDIVHETYYGSFKRKYKTPVVITIHDMIYEKTNYKFHDREYLINAKRECIEKADGIICVSEWTRQELLQVYPNIEQKTRTIHHGISLPIIGQKPEGKLPISPFLLYVGLRDSYKNFNTLATSLGILHSRGIKIPLVAFGGPGFNSDEKRHFEKILLASDLLFHLKGSDYNLSWLYQNALAFIFPSLNEGFGIPLLEAMSVGCPVLCSHASCFPEIAGNAGLYFDPNSSEDIADKIEAIHANYGNMRSTLISNGLNNCRDFGWNRCVNKTLELYENLSVNS